MRGCWTPDVARTEPVYQSRSARTDGDIVVDPSKANHAALRTALEGSGADAMVVLWGVTTPRPDWPLSGNTSYALKALDLASELGLEHVVLMSSAAIYRASPDAAPFRETDDQTPPLSDYGLAKRAMEAAATAWYRRRSGHRHVPNLTILRLANVVGADMLGDSIRTCGLDRPLRLDRFADGTTPRRSYLSPRSLVRALDAILRAPATAGVQTFNLADTRDGLEMQDILQVCRDLGRDVVWQHHPAPATAIPSVLVDSTRFLARYPRAAAGFRTSAADLVADWLAVED